MAAVIDSQPGVESPDFLAIHEAFADSSHGKELSTVIRWEDYKPDHITPEEWVRLLGVDFNDLEHHPYIFLTATEFIRQCNEAPGSHPDAVFTEFETNVLLLAAITNNWGDSDPAVGNVIVEKRTPQHTEREKKAWGACVDELLPDLNPQLREVVAETIFDTKAETKLSQAWDAIQRITYLHDLHRAFEIWQTTTDEKLKEHLGWLCAAGLKNQTDVLVEYGEIYEPVRQVLLANALVITNIFDTLNPDQLFELGGEMTHKRDQFLLERRRWQKSEFANAVQSPVPTRIERILPMEALFEHLRRITFRGIYDSEGRPVHPYKDAKFSIGTVLPANTKMNLPTLRVGAREEDLYTPQPTIYANQTQVLEIVEGFLGKNGMTIFDLQGAVDYFWPGRGRYSMLPPIIERHRFSLEGGYIDIEDLMRQFEGLHLKDAKGNLHDMSAKVLQNFFVDEVSSADHFDILHTNVPLENYGRQCTGEWDFNIICDGAHRVDLAIEGRGRPITVIYVEPAGDAPLPPYYALPLPFRPTTRLTSKRAEDLHPRLERDKFHLLAEIVRKTLHYDWSPAGLNVSSLRGQRS